MGRPDDAISRTNSNLSGLSLETKRNEKTYEWDKISPSPTLSPNSTIFHWEDNGDKGCIAAKQSDGKDFGFGGNNHVAKFDPTDTPPRGFSFWTSRNSNRRFGVFCCALTALVVFLMNLALAVAIVVMQDPSKDGQYILFDGQCLRTRRFSLLVHILINLLSTVLLAASNFCMQHLSAPTRKDIDRAHAKRQWLEIGVQSLRNLRYISLRRRVLWILLGLSSLPLHLL
jgi:hypothetical protein